MPQFRVYKRKPLVNSQIYCTIVNCLMVFSFWFGLEIVVSPKSMWLIKFLGHIFGFGFLFYFGGSIVGNPTFESAFTTAGQQIEPHTFHKFPERIPSFEVRCHTWGSGLFPWGRLAARRAVAVLSGLSLPKERRFSIGFSWPKNREIIRTSRWFCWCCVLVTDIDSLPIWVYSWCTLMAIQVVGLSQPIVSLLTFKQLTIHSRDSNWSNHTNYCNIVCGRYGHTFWKVVWPT